MGFVFEELSGTIISWYELKAIKNKLSVIEGPPGTGGKADQGPVRPG